ncbi:MAG: hypothetical protein GKR89_14620 [Candidatus Latescibacteria bacterium]|nr:hypothetical protein [Candidatus Latescibacterota bacterium]
MSPYIRNGLCLLLLAVFGCSQNESDKQSDEAIKGPGLAQLDAVRKMRSAQGGRESLGGISVAVPDGWRTVDPSSSMRVAEYHMSGARPQDKDATLAVFAGNMGSVEANVERWFGQFTRPGGAAESPRRWQQQVDGMEATLVDIRGTYSPGMGRGTDAAPAPDYRMLGAIVSTGRTSFYFKLVGPRDTVALWVPIFKEFIGGIKKE